MLWMRALFNSLSRSNTLKFLPENKVQFYQNLFKNIRKKYKKLPPEKHPKIRVESFPYNYALKSD